MKLIIKILVSAVAIAIAAFLSPMRVGGFMTAIKVAIVMGIIDWAIESFTNFKYSPTKRGISGFLVGAVIIYATGFLVNDFYVSIPGALIGALVLGVVSAIIPGDKTFD